jgi:hypothetical protein
MEDNSKEINTSKHKNLSQTNTQNNHNQTQDSITKVYLRVGEPKVTVSFKCNKELWDAFKLEIKRKKLSICHVLEPMIFGWLYGEVYLSNTIRPLKIENLIVERAVRRVRRYAVEVEGSGCWYCGGKVVGMFRFLPRGEVYPLCKRCSEELLKSGKWSVVKE